MIPAAYVHLSSMPLTPNGKLDQRALPAPDDKAFARQSYEAPISETEIKLASIWSELLDIERISRHDNFFALGGHSLLIVRMLAKLRKINLDTNVREIFSTPSLAELAKTLVHHKAIIIPPNPITAESTFITPYMLPLITLSQAEIDTLITQVPGGVVNIQDIYGLAPLQQGILFHHIMAEHGDPYLILRRLEFQDRVSLQTYASALQQVIERHDILRTVFIWEGLSEPAQVVLRRVPSLLAEVTLNGTDEPALEQLINRFNTRHYRLDLKQPPLLRLIAAPMSEGGWVALQLNHHLIGDHITSEKLYAEVKATNDGQNDQLVTPAPFRNLVAQARLGISQTDHVQFFKEMLADIETPTLPFGLNDVHSDGTEVDEEYLKLPKALNNRLRAHAQNLQVSLASLCHLAWAQVLARASGSEKVVFGTVLLGRLQSGEGNDSAMGLLMNTLPLRLDVDAVSVESAVHLTHSRLSTLLEHEHVSLALAQRCSAVKANLPLFNALLNYRHNQHTEHITTPIPGVTFLDSEERTNYPITLSVEDDRDALGVTAQVVSPISAARICAYMQQALASLADALSNSPKQHIRTLTIMPQEEREMLLRSWNQTTVNYPSVRCFHQLFEEQVERDGQAIAVEWEGEKISYAELNAQANQLAHYLITKGVKPDDLIAFCVKRSTKMIVAILGILKAGCAYVPLDPAYSSQRLMNILQDSMPHYLLADVIGEKVLGNHQIPILDLDQKITNRFSTDNLNPTKLGLTPNHLAYVIYTSGSTGTPKGVMIEHQSVYNLANAMRPLFGVNPMSRVLFFATCAFDASLWEILMALTSGACLCMPNEETRHMDIAMLNYLSTEKITHVTLPPALFRNTQDLTHLNGLQALILGGETPPLSLLQTASIRTKVFNVYGPTETTIWSTMWSCPVDFNNASVPIGRPFSNTQTYVLDSHGEPVLLGAEGELYIGGAGVARGYLNRPELTAECFLPDPFSENPEARMYRTGDRARYLPDGNLVFLGRTDQQVKIRGFRIEPGEIEARLIEHPLVHDAVVLSWKNHSDTDARLVAYVVAEQHKSLSQNLRTYLATLLPDYMVPAAYVCLSALPLTPNGKLDRRALPPPDDESFSRHSYEAPKNEMEIKLATIWSELLGIERISRHDNFFELGGHSLMVMQFVTQAKIRFCIHVDPRGLFSFPILKDFAERVTNSSDRLYCDAAVPARQYGDQTPLFLLPDGRGDTSYAFELAHEIDKSIPIYVLLWSSPENEQPTSIEEMATRMIPKIKEVQPNGPCAIAGYSSGGILAYEITKQLISSGYPVSFLGLIDTYFPRVSDIPNETVWWERVSKLSLTEAIEEVKEKNIDLKNSDIDWEVLLLKQRVHYQNICRVYKVNSLPIIVDLFKATEFLLSPTGNEYLDKNIQKRLDCAKKLYNRPKLGWESVPSLRVILVNGGHFTMMSDPKHRALLGRRITQSMLSK
ncbi:uncharacterized protein LOC116348934 [Contarinia nasturtii]|uniref:uncharacterized protein LOC116348934 n=1 Tax=Contarinia nasturtii TaxID=265458 RepID=UPI0012D4B03D|nr:uncharacterized protein LOC116348934 [Contarinia nasturtii]